MILRLVILAFTIAHVFAARFTTLDVFVEPAGKPVAAFQIQLQFEDGTTVVGVEGGEHAEFKKAPYYDPKAIQKDRIIVAAFSVAAPNDLPKTRTRLLTLHLQTPSEKPVAFKIKKQLVSDHTGKTIDVPFVISERNP